MIILASTSPRRQELLKILRLDFKVVPSEVDEVFDLNLTPREQAEVLARRKAATVARRFPEDIVIGADTVVALGNEMLGKPTDEQDAKRMLKKLKGRMHSIITGLAIIDSSAQRTIIKSVETKVWFRRIEPSEISSYLEKEKPYDRAGAYGIQDMGAVFVDKIEGDYYGAVGLPLYTLARELKKLGVSVL